MPVGPNAMPAGAPSSWDLAKRISEGHAFNKHVVQQAEYPGGTDKLQFGKIVQDAIENAGAEKALANGRYAWWDDVPNRGHF